MSLVTAALGRRRPLYLMLGFVILALSAYAVLRFVAPHSFSGMVLQSPQPARNFTLTAHTGEEVSLSDFRGKVVALFFGYTNCPDVCPTTLAELKQAHGALADLGDELQVLMVSVDPERDTVEKMAAYVPSFNASFLGLTADEEAIAEVAAYYGVFFQRAKSESALGYLVDHSSSVLVIDKEGYLRVVFPFGTPGEQMASDFRYLISR